MSKREIYSNLLPLVDGLLTDQQQPVSIYANIAALLKEQLPYASWIGFYLFNGTALYLGPFQGKVACVDITLDRGVCGKAGRTKKTVIVNNVHDFPGHIACDAGSQSEIVVPLLHNDQLIAVLDLDSYDLASFDSVDQEFLEIIARKIITKIFQ
jgi:GAF domain-containing protein